MKHFYSAKHNGFLNGDTKGAYGIAWPADAVEVTEQQLRAFTGTPPAGKALGPDKVGRPMWVNAGEGSGMTPPQQADLMGEWVGLLLDSTAQLYGYDNIVSAVSWAGDSDAFLSMEGTTFKLWRSAVWKAAVPLIAQVRNGERDIPVKVEFYEKLPAHKAPVGAVPMKKE